jgi:hypothetical protein
MGAEKLLKSESVETGVSLNIGRGFKFTVSRQHDQSGFEVYIIENVAKKQALFVPRFLFEIFRGALQKVVRAGEYSEEPVVFKGSIKFRIESSAVGVTVMSVDRREGAGGELTLGHEAARGLSDFLYDPRLRHGSDVLSRILAYHRLFKFTFSDGSESLTSGLSLRTDVLSHVEDYIPAIGQRASRMKVNYGTDSHRRDMSNLSGRERVNEKDLKTFKSRLGERSAAKVWSVDYQALFGSHDQGTPDRQPKVNSSDDQKRGQSVRHVWELPILATEIRTMRGRTIRCELAPDEIQSMREI